MGVQHRTTMVSRSNVLPLLFVLASSLCLGALATKSCSDSEFEAPHHDWDASCVSRFMEHIGLGDKAPAFFAADIVGSGLKNLNASVLESMNISKTTDQESLLENIARLERHNPATSGVSSPPCLLSSDRANRRNPFYICL